MIEVGSKVKDKITGYEGIVTCRSQWIYGCVRLLVQSQELHEGKPVESHVFDEPQAILVATPEDAGVISQNEIEALGARAHAAPHGDRPAITNRPKPSRT